MKPRRAWLAIALALAGCGSSSSGTSSDSCGDLPASSTGGTTQASAADVRGILAGNCALGGCHGNAPGAGGLVLSMRTSSSWADALVGVPSQENPSMNLVTAGDPQSSWLVHKVFGAVCGYSCDPSIGCGGQMPFGGSLGPADRATIVAWVEGGAPKE
jgi:hypothetical protein